MPDPSGLTLHGPFSNNNARVLEQPGPPVSHTTNCKHTNDEDDEDDNDNDEDCVRYGIRSSRRLLLMTSVWTYRGVSLDRAALFKHPKE